MTDPRLFSPAEAFAITGVSPTLAQSWRRRGLLPDSEGRWTRYSPREICRLRLVRAFTEAGIALSDALEYLSDDFLDAMQGAMIARYRTGLAVGYAVIATRPGATFRCLTFHLAEMDWVERSVGFEPTALIVIPLANLAADMAEQLRSLDIPLETF